MSSHACTPSCAVDGDDESRVHSFLKGREIWAVDSDEVADLLAVEASRLLDLSARVRARPWHWGENAEGWGGEIVEGRRG